MTAAMIETKMFDGPDAHARLRDLGLDVPTLREVVLQGEQARAEATEHDPINAAAWDAYRYRVRAFRDRTVPSGWTVDHDGGLEKTWSPDRKHVVITRAGDAGVGVRSACPQPKRKPGTEIRGIVEGASLLDPNWMNVTPKGAANEDFATWMLLVNREGDVVRSELSSPDRPDRRRHRPWLARAGPAPRDRPRGGCRRERRLDLRGR
jgi:hypothetical protein